MSLCRLARHLSVPSIFHVYSEYSWRYRYYRHVIISHKYDVIKLFNNGAVGTSNELCNFIVKRLYLPRNTEGGNAVTFPPLYKIIFTPRSFSRKIGSAKYFPRIFCRIPEAIKRFPVSQPAPYLRFTLLLCYHWYCVITCKCSRAAAAAAAAIAIAWNSEKKVTWERIRARVADYSVNVQAKNIFLSVFVLPRLDEFIAIVIFKEKTNRSSSLSRSERKIPKTLFFSINAWYIIDPWDVSTRWRARTRAQLLHTGWEGR